MQKVQSLVILPSLCLLSLFHIFVWRKQQSRSTRVCSFRHSRHGRYPPWFLSSSINRPTHEICSTAYISSGTSPGQTSEAIHNKSTTASEHRTFQSLPDHLRASASIFQFRGQVPSQVFSSFRSSFSGLREQVYAESVCSSVLVRLLEVVV